MIRIIRPPEPAELPQIRAEEVQRLEGLVTPTRPPTSEDFKARTYDGPPGRPTEFKGQLRLAQYFKCGWCEHQEPLRNRDIEHYRPKTRAVGRDGQTRVGYWWLAWTWENLFFSCDGCNRYEKNDHFPLRDERRRLKPKQPPPGPEVPLLLDPADHHIDPMEHLQFRPVDDPGDWRVFPRNGSVLGQWTIQVMGLNRDELRTLYRHRYEVDLRTLIVEKLEDLKAAREDPSRLPDFRERWRRYIRAMNAPSQRFAGLVHDIHDLHFPPTLRRMLDLAWRRP